MFRKTMTALAVAALLTLGGASAAIADDTAAPDGSNYTPRTPAQPSLTGTTAGAECRGDSPWIHFNVVLTDPDQESTSNAATLIMSDGTHSTTIDLGTLVNGRLSGSVLWPGASVDAAGHPATWPGWENRNGSLTQTSGNFAWTRGNITATIDVNPSIVVPVSYPAVTSGCANPMAVSSAAILPVTGLNVPVVPIAIGGGIVLLAGAGLLVARRRMRRS